MTNDTERSFSKYYPPLISFAVAFLYSLPFLINWNYIGIGDWELFTTMAAIPERTVLHYHQFPFWNPYLGGGNILFAHPEAGILSPFFLIILLVGAVGALKIQVLLTYFLGLWGTYLFSRKLGMSEIASYMVSFAYFGSTYFGLHYAIGHMPFTQFCFLPWFLYFLFKSGENWKYIFGSTLAIFLMIVGNGGAVPFVFTAFFSGLLVIFLSIESKSVSIFKRYLFGLFSGVFLAGIKFFPMIAYLFANQWKGMPDDFTTWKIAGSAFFSWYQKLYRVMGPDQHWGWHEYSAYISPLLIILAVIAIIFIFKKSRSWLVLTVFFFALGMGHFSDYSPWNLLLQFPGFSSLRCPSRMFQFVILSVAVMGGYGIDFATARLKMSEKKLKYVMLGVVAIVLINNFLLHLPAFGTLSYKKVETVSFNENFQNVVGRKDNIYRQFQENRGSLVTPWLSGYKDSRALLTPTNDVLMEFVSGGQAQVTRTKFSPNRVEYSINPSSPGSVVFSIGYDGGWHAGDERRIYEYNGLVATDFGLNDREIVLYYRTPYFWTGFLISVLAGAILLLLYLNRKAGERLKAIFQ